MMKKFIMIMALTSVILCMCAAAFALPLGSKKAGRIKSGVDLSHLNDADNLPDLFNNSNNNKVKTADTIPATYDLRGTGRIPDAVRNQDFSQWCWVFAAIGSCESNYLTRSLRGELDGSLGDAETLHFPEQYLPWFIAADPENGKSVTVTDEDSGKFVVISLSKMTSLDLNAGYDAVYSAMSR